MERDGKYTEKDKLNRDCEQRYLKGISEKKQEIQHHEMWFIVHNLIGRRICYFYNELKMSKSSASWF